MISGKINVFKHQFCGQTSSSSFFELIPSVYNLEDFKLLSPILFSCTLSTHTRSISTIETHRFYLLFRFALKIKTDAHRDSIIAQFVGQQFDRSLRSSFDMLRTQYFALNFVCSLKLAASVGQTKGDYQRLSVASLYDAFALATDLRNALNAL